MMRKPSVLVGILALALLVAFCSTTWAAAERPAQGTLEKVNAAQHQITVTARDGKNYNYQVMENAPIFIPNEVHARLVDLKAGERISMLWEKKGDQYFVSALMLHQGEFKNAGLAAATIKNVSADNTQFTATDSRGKEWTYHMADSAKLRLNGKESRLSDYRANHHVALVWEKKGDQYRVLSMCEDPARTR